MAHQLTNFKQTPFPISYTQQIDVHRNNMRTVLLYRAVGIIGIGLSHSKVNRLYLGIVFLEFIRYAQCHIPRDFGTCTDRQLQIHCDTRYEVLSGVPDGARVVVAGQSRLHNGAEVTVVE